MKANKTKQLIDELVQVAFGNRELDNKRMHDMCGLADEEIQEIERLAEIGEAFEKTTSKEHCQRIIKHYKRESMLNNG